MRLKAIKAMGVLPVRHFAVDNLSDVVVLAGPNGVGKSRLIQGILQALQNPVNNPHVRLVVETTSEEEINFCGKRVLDTENPQDAQALAKLLQRSRRRTKWQSSVVQFESDRTIQAYNPFNFSFDINDPWNEDVGWNQTFGFLKDRFQDTLHSIFRKTQSRLNEIAKMADAKLKSGDITMSLGEFLANFPDPLLPFKDAFAQLLAPKILLDVDIRQQQLFYQHEGNRFPVSTLSSGEREVVNIVFDFLLRSPSDCIVMFDEPELHLHPELSYRLIQTLRGINVRNQFLFSTHSADIISSSLDNTVIFLSPPRADETTNQAIIVREDDETHQALNLLGQSIGIISLGKKLVLIEGTHGSLDKQTYGSILKNRFPNLVLVPSGGKGVISSFSTLITSVLERTIWGVEFFMLCDRDAIPLSRSIDTVESAGKGRLKILKRYHLENYFLEAEILAKVFATMEPEDSWLRDPIKVKARLKEIASSNISYAAALAVASEFRDSVGNINIMPGDCHSKSCAQLVELIAGSASIERTRVGGILDAGVIEASVKSTFEILRQSLEDPNDSWKQLIPGRQIFNIFASNAKLDTGRLKILYLAAATTHTFNPFADVIATFEEFSRT